MAKHLSYPKSARSSSGNDRNGYKQKQVNSSYGSVEISVPQDRKPFAADRKTIYTAPDEQTGAQQRDRVAEKWKDKCPHAMKSWTANWDAIVLIFNFSAEVRAIIYTTNSIESLNSSYRRLNSQRSVFPGDQALLKALYLATFETTRKWTKPIRNWGLAYGELSIMYERRLLD